MGVFARLATRPLWRKRRRSSRTLVQTTSPSFVLTNISFSTRDLWQRMESTAGIYDAFDVDHPFPGAQEHLQPILHQDGRTYTGQIAVKF